MVTLDARLQHSGMTLNLRQLRDLGSSAVKIFNGQWYAFIST